MAVYESYPWSELVVGAYVYDATGKPWLLIDKHSTAPGVFRARDAENNHVTLRDPGKPVRAAVPDHNQALDVVRRVLPIKEIS